MPSIKLTDKSVERLPFSPDYIEYYDTRLTGFGVKTGPKSKVYFVAGRAGKEQFKRKVGKVGVMEYDTALNLAQEVLKLAAAGVHPDVSLKASEAARTKAQKGNATLEWFFEDYITTRKKLKQSTKDHYKQKLDCYVSDWMKKPLRDVTPTMAIAKHAEIGKKSKAQANHVFRVIRAIYNHAMALQDDMFPKNPVKMLSRMSAWYKVPRKKTYLKPSQLKLFFKALQDHPGMISDYLEVLVLTGCRPMEVGALKVTMLFLKDGLITLDETKTTEDYLIPVSARVSSILERRKKEIEGKECLYLFPSRMWDGHIKDVRKTTEIIFEGTGLALTPYDLRRTFLTYSDEIGVTKFVQKRLVGHVIPEDVTDGYIQLTIPRLKRDTEKITQEILLQSTPEPEESTEEEG